MNNSFSDFIIIIKNYKPSMYIMLLAVAFAIIQTLFSLIKRWSSNRSRRP